MCIRDSHEYPPAGQKVNQDYYISVLRRLRDAIRQKQPQLHKSGAQLLQRDKESAHTSHSVQNFLAIHNIPQLQHPPYSLDMVSCDRFLPKDKQTN